MRHKNDNKVTASTNLIFTKDSKAKGSLWGANK